MQVKSSWIGTSLKPETEEEENIIDQLWSVLPADECHINIPGIRNFNDGATFIRSGKTLFISSGE